VSIHLTSLSRVAPVALGAILFACAGAAAADADRPPDQAQATGAADQGQQARARVRARESYQIRTMEGVLERAVQHGAQVVSAEVRQVSPDLLLFSGPARARGYRLENYGVFFSVDVPAVRRSLVWSVRTLAGTRMETMRALDSLRRAVATQPEGQARAEFERALKLVELQVGPVLPESGTAPGEPARTVVRLPGGAEPIADPGAAYEREVSLALTDAMLDYGPPLEIGDDEWLTVAARDAEDRSLGGDVFETVTVVLRIKGGDLTAFRAGRLSRDEARQRVDVKEF
jgi:hypothetical protein